MTHKLKTHPAAFRAVTNGWKKFEFRRNDRNFQAGDTLALLEFDPVTGFTGFETWRVVTYILRGPDFGVPLGFCVMSIT